MKIARSAAAKWKLPTGGYKQTGGDGYLTPPEYTAIWEEKTCTHCGHKESNEPSY